LNLELGDEAKVVSEEQADSIWVRALFSSLYLLEEYIMAQPPGTTHPDLGSRLSHHLPQQCTAGIFQTLADKSDHDARIQAAACLRQCNP
jgi:hypothetical protein